MAPGRWWRPVGDLWPGDVVSAGRRGAGIDLCDRLLRNPLRHPPGVVRAAATPPLSRYGVGRLRDATAAPSWMVPARQGRDCARRLRVVAELRSRECSCPDRPIAVVE